MKSKTNTSCHYFNKEYNLKQIIVSTSYFKKKMKFENIYLILVNEKMSVGITHHSVMEFSIKHKQS